NAAGPAGAYSGSGGSIATTGVGTGGAGGIITLDGGKVSVSGTNKTGASIQASGGSATGVPGNPGTIKMHSYCVQYRETSFDFVTNKPTVVALAGGMLSVGQTGPINGVKGTIFVDGA